MEFFRDSTGVVGCIHNPGEATEEEEVSYLLQGGGSCSYYVVTVWIAVSYLYT